ncbi:YesL family protein [Fredinandcohnia quinoae]|uniref:YesL family protein n=1 Tax=Fredinandcohnia quinoae TaxID=2918902 RepID=A0AAW5E8J6_9BACI|nr:YesL family protein [Fredinandcohnia sp. SECRCQ15]MCH1625458.1 YesL family protein [Fredinandcohnia sp. SECRCQ15]
MEKMAERWNFICIRILQLAYLNLLWFSFTLLGLVLFGIGPATFAMFTVIRKWIRGNADVAIFPTYWKAYRENFKETASIGLLYAVIGLILYTDLLYVQSLWLRIILLMVSICYLISSLYIFPVIAHYDWKSVVLKIKCSFLFGISYFQYSLMLIVILGVMCVIQIIVPGLLLFFGISGGGYVIMWFANQVFMRMEIQAGLIEEENARTT